MFVRDDWTLFRNLNTLGQKAGVGKDRLAALVLKELVDNALDVSEDCRVGPGPTERSFFVEDDGPGIDGTDEELCRLFSIRRPLTSTKLFRLPTRGALGNGLRVVTGAVLASGGTLAVRTRGRLLELRPKDDGTTEVVDSCRAEEAGTRVELSFGPALEANHPLWLATLAVRMKGTPYLGKSSPWWYDSDSFFELLQAAEGACLYDILEGIGGRYPVGADRVEAGLPSVDAETTLIDRGTSEMVLSALRESCKAPAPAVLGSVGEWAVPSHGYGRKSGTVVLDPAVGQLSAHLPVVAEAWATRLERGERPRVRVYVNRTPIGAHVSAGTTGGKKKQMIISGCGIDHLFKAGRDPVHVDLCVTSPYMPITTDGKEPNLEPMLELVYSVVEGATRKAQKKGVAGARATKIDTVISLLPDAMSDASGGGKHRFSLRQLYYAVRPLLQATGDEDELTYTYFAQIITKHEAALGHDLPDIYRDARGTLYHPHTGQSISIGTLAVEKYERPTWTFNKILYIEKGGFFPLLVDEKWPERHDCALLTSQGFATRAARDVIDLLGETSEPVQFFCIHDADAHGTNIHEKLVEATLARPARKVQVTNLGLEPWEAKELGLLSENLVRKDDDDIAVAPYVRAYDRVHGTSWRDWLQHSRYELNAMNSPQFLDWLDDKMASQAGKVVPPQDILVETFRTKTRENIRKILIDRLAKQHKVEDQVKALMTKLAAEPDPGLVLDGTIRSHFQDESADSWKVPVGKAADEAATRLVGP